MNAVLEFARYRGGTVELEKIEREFGSTINFSDEKNYTEEEFLKLAMVVGRIIGCNTDKKYHECERQFAKFMHRILVRKYPSLVSRYSTYEELIMSIRDVHERIPLIQNPDKIYAERIDEKIILHYVSPTKLDYFFEQMLLEFAKQFSTTIEINYEKKMTRGDDETVAVVKIGGN